MSAIDQSGEVAAVARELILRDEGLFFLEHAQHAASYDFTRHVLNCADAMLPTAIEAFATVLHDPGLQSALRVWNKYGQFADHVNLLLREYRVSYELIAVEMIPFASRELHVEVVAPTLTLLAGDDRWRGAESAYRKALEEIARGDAADAVTDAGTALQEALTALGASGNALGPLIKSARMRRLLAPHDGPLLDAIERTMNWVAADRSTTGDAHSSRPASIDDAWLIVHIVGALMLRLSKGGERA